jgi:hypothetical protein
MQRAELRQYKKKAKAQIELLPTPLGQGDRQEPIRDGGTLRLISLNICLITLSTSSNYTNNVARNLTFPSFPFPLQPLQT